jgi:hypothetical protein
VKSLVNLVENWEQLLDYAGRAAHQTARAYQIFQEKEKTILRILVGRYGYQKEFADSKDPSLLEIVDKCDVDGFLNVSTTIPDDDFFFK